MPRKSRVNEREWCARYAKASSSEGKSLTSYRYLYAAPASCFFLGRDSEAGTGLADAGIKMRGAAGCKHLTVSRAASCIPGAARSPSGAPRAPARGAGASLPGIIVPAMAIAARLMIIPILSAARQQDPVQGFPMPLYKFPLLLPRIPAPFLPCPLPARPLRSRPDSQRNPARPG